VGQIHLASGGKRPLGVPEVEGFSPSRAVTDVYAPRDVDGGVAPHGAAPQLIRQLTSGGCVTKKYMALLVALATALALAVPVGAEETPELAGAEVNSVVEGAYDSYIVVLKADPLVVTEGRENLQTARAKTRGQALARGHDQVLEESGINAGEKVHSYVNAINGFSALVSYNEALAIAAHKDVAAVYPDELRQPTTENTPDFLGLTGTSGPWGTGILGKGVVIGVIDTGIWPEHPSFADTGSYPTPPVSGIPCEFGNTAHNPNDAAFTCNNKLIGARQVLPTYRALIGADPDEFDSARDDDGHGTHTASTAGGNSGVEASILGIERGVVSGIAPRAHIVAYKGLGNLGGFGSDLAAAIDLAVADGVDVINYSIGSSSFAIGPDDIAFLFAADAGVFVATSNGNTGPGAATTGSPASVPWLTAVGANTHDRTFQGSASSSDGGWEFFGASITTGTDELSLVDAADAGDELCNPGALDPSVVSGNIVLCKRGVIARVAKSEAVFLADGAGMILYNENDAESQVTDTHWVPSVHINNTDGLVIKDYIDAAADPVAQITGGEATAWPGSVMADFSSRGPNRLSADIIKPDVTAPGVNVLAGASPFPNPGSVPGELFQSISGTSMSSPHVAGIFALIKQAHPTWSAAMAKSALMTSARQNVLKEDGSTQADPFDMGAGHIDPGSGVHKGSAFQPGLVYDAGLFEYAAFTCGADLGVFTTGTCAALEGLGIPSDPSDLNLASIGVADLAGSQTVTRTVTSVAQEAGWRTYRAVVDAPDGYSVTVSPDRIRLRRGESATFEVTITNVSGPVDAWRFGSLTWTSNKADVYSPIAVKASLFSGPDLVTGSGESGSASFDVTFGYTGVYSAAAHGLESATVESDTVVQDPDQNFDPSDGFSNTHTFDVSGAALLRVAIPPEATEAEADLDIFLFGPGGTLVASSTNGGTDELIDIVDPADGTWTLYVQGWAAPGGDSDYDLYSWILSSTPGGNLTIDSAPASATIGATETIEVSWTGATVGEWHLGAVSHSDAGGVIGWTLVEVDNR
jgi:subtilisin family serine protease